MSPEPSSETSAHGGVEYFAFATPPEGWLECGGQQTNDTKYGLRSIVKTSPSPPLRAEDVRFALLPNQIDGFIVCHVLSLRDVCDSLHQSIETWTVFSAPLSPVIVIL
jgi:hypothetical protein